MYEKEAFRTLVRDNKIAIYNNAVLFQKMIKEEWCAACSKAHQDCKKSKGCTGYMIPALAFVWNGYEEPSDLDESEQFEWEYNHDKILAQQELEDFAQDNCWNDYFE